MDGKLNLGVSNSEHLHLTLCIRRLGLILGSKIFVDLTKYEFGECVSRINKEMVNIKKELGKSTQVVKATETKTQACPKEPEPAKAKNEDSATKWDQDRVASWFEERKISKKIQNALGPCNGDLLSQYHKMYHKIPKYFLTELQADSLAGERISLKEQALFVNELEKLFDDAK